LPQELRLHGIQTVEAANAFLREQYIGEFYRRFQVASAQPGSAFMPCRAKDLEHIFSLQFERTVNRDNTVNFQNLTLQIEPVRWRGTLAGCTVIVHQHLDGTLSLSHGPHSLGRYDERGGPIFNPKLAAGKARGKDARWKSPKADFPTALGNPAKCAGFPLSHRLGGCGRLTQNRTFHLLRKADVLTC
jgi:hypothetical protein